MTGKSIQLGLAAIAMLLASLPLAPRADAGGGVQLQFGGPLGTFTARENPNSTGGGSSGYGKHKPSKPKSHYKKPAQPAPTAARHKAKPNRNVAKSTIRSTKEAPPKAAAVQREPRVVSRGTVEDTATDTVTPSSGTRSLAAGALPLSEPIAATGKPDENITAVDAPDSDQAELTQAAAPATGAKVETADVKAEECKKFIPAVGITVTVACGE